MSDETTIDRVTAVAQAELGLDPTVVLTPDTNLPDVVWLDSVRLMTFVEAIERAFGIGFDIEKLSGDAVTHVGQLVALIEQSDPA